MVYQPDTIIIFKSQQFITLQQDNTQQSMARIRKNAQNKYTRIDCKQVIKTGFKKF